MGDDAYGVTIQKKIEERTGRPIALSAIYITLERLVKKGYLSSTLGEPTPERGGRAKRFFKVLAPGKTALDESWNSIVKMAGDLKPNLEGA